MDADALKHYLADSPPTCVPLEIRPHFEALKENEKRYAHYISVSSFAGSRIVLRQCSPESEHIYDLIIALYHHCKGDWAAIGREASLSNDEVRAFLDYAAQFLGNCGNYKGFGDSKFVPRLSESKFEALAGVSKQAQQAYGKTNRGIFAGDDAAKLHLGYPEQGHVSNYYPDSANITKEEITIISDFFDAKGLLPENTRMRKTESGDFEVLIASAKSSPSSEERDLKETEWQLEGKLAGKKVSLVFGDHSVEMQKIADALKEAQKAAANDTETKMMAEYVKSFETGSLEAYKQSQRYWIQDKGPMVESDIGFVETYRDPHGIRGEWEGYASIYIPG